VSPVYETVWLDERGYTVRSITTHVVNLTEKEKLDAKAVKRPGQVAPTNEYDLERLKKAQAKQARKDQIKRNGGKR